MEGKSLGSIGEIIQGASHALGIATGFSQAASTLRERSGKLFAEGKQDEARQCYKFAEELSKVSKEKRMYFGEHCATLETEAFTELDNRQQST